MYDILYRFWNDRKAKVKHKELNFAYFTEILEKLIQCFDYDNIPEGIDVSFLETYLLINGSVGIAPSKINPGYIAFIGGYADDLNEYGLGTNYVGATCGASYDGKINQDLIVGQNNSIRTGRVNLLERYSGLLANLEESISIGVVNSRMLPIIEAADEKDVNQIESIVKQSRSGEPVAMTSKRLNSLFEDNATSLNTVELFKSADVNKLQYYSRFYEDTLKRLWIESGVEITNKDKAAQVNSEELESYRAYSRITIEDMLKCRKKMCEDFNSLYGGTWRVKLNHNFDNKLNAADGANTEEASEEKSEEVTEKKGRID